PFTRAHLYRPCPRHRRSSPLFPSTTLFRSAAASHPISKSPTRHTPAPPAATPSSRRRWNTLNTSWPKNRSRRWRPDPSLRWVKRSEEHTSELQSRFDLVCRLLLEKQKETLR